MKYTEKNPPLVCMMTQSTCYKKTRGMDVLGVLWHSTGANNPALSRYVQPDDNAWNRSALLNTIGVNKYANDWNHIEREAGLNAWVGKLADGTVSSVQTMPWTFRPCGCGSGSKGSCNSGWVQFEICEDDLTNPNYFEAAYREAVELTAYICKLYGIDPKGTVTINGVKIPTILCHADSYKLGFGSNHGDVLHWFKKFGKTMDDVRNDVAASMGSAAETPAPAHPEGKTSIMGEAQATAQQMALYCRSKNAEPQITSCTLEELAGMFLEEGRAEGVRGDVAWAQSLHETGFFKFGGIVLPMQNNFAGIGALNGNATGQAATFPDPRTGVRAQIQHLKAYASTEPLVNACVDPRFSLVARGCAPWVEWLGASDNPQGKGWAVPGKGYGASVIKLLGAVVVQETPQSPVAPQETAPLAQFPEWQREGLTRLVEAGIINSPDVWAARYGTQMTVGEIFGILGRMCQTPQG